ncbi:glycosyltransferase family 2 protein [Hyphomicrobium sp.]|jgi:succinoglycan biosynthesis protein ExoM|uniref:glycosyltransferase family 2 protein n=1 Tax=Hyphomicrobium sp. TaxID=82 RepID=UPI0035615773
MTGSSVDVVSGTQSGASAAQPHVDQLVAICACTYKRPVMLEACLASLVSQKPIGNMRYRIIVVDNDSERSGESAARRFGPDIAYFVELKRGISFARNAALMAASDLGADWIAFIDDDEIADTSWLAELMSSDYFSVAILRGYRILQAPQPAPYWDVAGRSKKPIEGEFCHTAYTHNVRFSRAVVDKGFKFDERLALSGGEDVDFFTRARKAGFEIRQTARAITFEAIHPERLTFLRQCQESYWIAAANIRESIVRQGLATTLVSKLHTIPLNLFLGPLLIMFSPFALPLGPCAFKKMALTGGDKIARAIGRAAALLGHIPSPYKNIDGK